MHYRRLSYRYRMTITRGTPELGDIWHTQPWRLALAQPHWRPATDVYETTSAVTITVELAGVNEEEVNVLLYEDAVVISGERRLPHAAGNGVYHTAEIQQGPFQLAVLLPAGIEAEQVEARYEQGLLRLTLPKRNGRDQA